MNPEISKTPKQIAQETVHKKLDEIYHSIAKTIDDVSKTAKAAGMTGPEALRYVAGLIRSVKRG